MRHHKILKLDEPAPMKPWCVVPNDIQYNYALLDQISIVFKDRKGRSPALLFVPRRERISSGSLIFGRPCHISRLAAVVGTIHLSRFIPRFKQQTASTPARRSDGGSLHELQLNHNRPLLCQTPRVSHLPTCCSRRKGSLGPRSSCTCNQLAD